MILESWIDRGKGPTWQWKTHFVKQSKKIAEELSKNHNHGVVWGNQIRGKLEKGLPLISHGEQIVCYNRDNSLQQAAYADDGITSLGIWVMAIRLNYEWTPLWIGCASGLLDRGYQ